MNNLGSALAQQGQFDAAIALFSEVLRVDPNTDSARKNRDLATEDGKHLQPKYEP